MSNDVTVVIGELDVEITDVDGNTATIVNDQLRVRDLQNTELLMAILAELKEMNQRISRMEDE